MQVLVIGSGYVGLVAAACFAEAGHRILGVDVDASKVATLSKGQSPIFEPGLDALLTKHLASGALRFTTDLREGIAQADAAFRAKPEDIGEVYVRSATTREMIPLKALLRMTKA